MFELSNIDNKDILLYGCIIAIFIVIFRFIDINLGMLLGVCLALIVVYFVYKSKEKKTIEKNDIFEEKKKLVIENFENLEKYKDVINFLFSIKDMEEHNYQVYLEMMENLDNFFRVLEESNNNLEKIGINYDLMISYKENSVNGLHSLIHSIANKEYEEKINKSIVILNKILNKYLKTIKKKYDEYIYENGYNTKSKLIGNKLKEAYNKYSNEDKYSYNIFS